MTIQFLENEFTNEELLHFLRKAYGTQINGKPFTSAVIRNWIRIKHFPVAYGGYKIISSTIHKEYGNIRTTVVEGLSRREAEEMVGSLNVVWSKDFKIEIVVETKRPRKQRTKLYYQILAAAGKQYTKKTLKQSTLPLYWRAAGIKRNQLINKSQLKK